MPEMLTGLIRQLRLEHLIQVSDTLKEQTGYPQESVGVWSCIVLITVIR